MRDTASYHVVYGGVPLVPPRRAGDCSCRFCSTFRAEHSLRSALLITPVPLSFLVLARLASADLSRRHVEGVTQAVGGLLIVATLTLFLALAAWSRPLRRLRHRRRPICLEWPPDR